jgi:hypothetical protein
MGVHAKKDCFDIDEYHKEKLFWSCLSSSSDLQFQPNNKKNGDGTSTSTLSLSLARG